MNIKKKQKQKKKKHNRRAVGPMWPIRISGVSFLIPQCTQCFAHGSSTPQISIWSGGIPIFPQQWSTPHNQGCVDSYRRRSVGSMLTYPFSLPDGYRIMSLYSHIAKRIALVVSSSSTVGPSVNYVFGFFGWHVKKWRQGSSKVKLGLCASWISDLL